MRIYVWAERVGLKGDPTKKFVGKAMAADGTMICQRPFASLDWAKQALGVGTEENKEAYLDVYPSGYEVVWLEDPVLDPGWWEATFFDDRRYRIQHVADPAVPWLWYFEFRDHRTSAVLGYVVYLDPAKSFYVVPGRVSPRFGDTFPDPPYTRVSEAMHAAHVLYAVSHGA